MATAVASTGVCVNAGPGGVRTPAMQDRAGVSLYNRAMASRREVVPPRGVERGSVGAAESFFFLIDRGMNRI